MWNMTNKGGKKGNTETSRKAWARPGADDSQAIQQGSFKANTESSKRWQTICMLMSSKQYPATWQHIVACFKSKNRHLSQMRRWEWPQLSVYTSPPSSVILSLLTARKRRVLYCKFTTPLSKFIPQNIHVALRIGQTTARLLWTKKLYVY